MSFILTKAVTASATLGLFQSSRLHKRIRRKADQPEGEGGGEKLSFPDFFSLGEAVWQAEEAK